MELATVADLAQLEHSQPQPGSTTESDQLMSSPAIEGCDCGGEGWVMGPDRRVRPCACQIEKRIRSRLPKLYWLARLQDFSEETRAFVISWLKEPTAGLLIWGAAGTGKTYLACAIVRTLLGAQQETEFRRCDDLYEALRECFGTNGNTRDLMRPFVGKDGEREPAKFVVLDDLGAGSLSDYERRTMLRIIDVRLNWMNPTIITTNWDLPAIAERMDDRIASRLSTYTPMEMQGRDRRVRR
jgi:IstB-like ATP binding protein